MLKVANRSFSIEESSPARCVSEREKGGGFAARESRTVGSGAPLVTFPATGKSPGCRAWLCHALAERLHSGSQELPPLQNPPGSEGRSPLPLRLWEIKQPAQREKRKIPCGGGKKKTCRKCRQQAKKFHLSVDKKSWKYYNNFCYGLIRRDKSVPERPASGGAGGVNLCCGRAEAKLPQRMGSYHYWERKLPCSLI